MFYMIIYLFTTRDCCLRLKPVLTEAADQRSNLTPLQTVKQDSRSFL